MKLAEYLRSNNLTEAAFAVRIGVSQATVNRYRNGRVPEPEVMGRIARVTGGAVQPNDFYSLPEEGALKQILRAQPKRQSNGSNASKSNCSSSSTASSRTDPVRGAA